jgi:hypothetical protein
MTHAADPSHQQRQPALPRQPSQALHRLVLAIVEGRHGACAVYHLGRLQGPLILRVSGAKRGDLRPDTIRVPIR